MMLFRHSRSMVVLVVFALCVISVCDGPASHAGDPESIRFENGENINLCAIRGAKTSASDNCTTPTDLVCRPVHTQEMRFHNNYGPAWWMIELPRTFMLSSHRIGYRDPMKSVGYRIKVSVKPMDESDWAIGRRPSRSSSFAVP
jgi:hypothetical protein